MELNSIYRSTHSTPWIHNSAALAWKLFAASLFAMSPSALASDDFFGEISVSSEAPEQQSALEFKGFIQQKFKYGIAAPNSEFDHERDNSGLEQIRTDLFGEVETDFAKNWKLRVSAKAELNYVQWQEGEQHIQLDDERVFLKDAIVDARFDNGHWLRVGHQLFAWGESESLAVSDVLSPTDQREFGQVELQDIREQVPAVLYSFPLANIKLSAVATYKAGYNRYANIDSRFYPYIALKGLEVRAGNTLTLERQSPDNEFEYALRADWQFNGGDLSLIAAEINDNDFHFKGLNQNKLALAQARQQTASIVANRVVGAWLLKGELGYFTHAKINQGFGHVTTDEIRGMLGAQYSGFNQWRISAELSGIQRGDTNTLTSESDDLGFTVHVQHTSLNEKLDQHFWLIELPANGGQVARWSMAYDWSDSWGFSSDVVIYDAESSAMLYPFAGNDSLNFAAKYSF